MANPTEEDPLFSNSTAAEAASAIAEDAVKDLEKVEKLMGRQHIALYGFIAIFLAVFASAIAYLAGRQGPSTSAPAKQQVAVQLPPARPVTVISPASAPAPAPLPVVEKRAAARVEAPAPVPAAAPAPLPTPAVLEEVLPNRMYLQVGSLDKNVAELLTQGLRIKGVPATVAPGVNAQVSRIIVGPFQTSTEMGVVQKQLSDLGFTPFPRQFQPAELRPALQTNAAAAPPKP
jgi:hypothetical protein